MPRSFMERLAKQLGINNSDEANFRGEIVSMVEKGCKEGFLGQEEGEMICNIFELSTREASDVMTHRKHVVGVDGEMSLHDAMDFMLNERHSRFPVYEESIDCISGLLFLKDAMRCMTQQTYTDWKVKDIPGLLRQAVFVQETKNLSSLFKAMQSEKLQMVIVADEYGQTAGLVAMEDILEVIVGNIQDEYDNEEPMIVKQEDGSFLISGLASLDQVEDELGITFEETEFETLNGYLISRLDKIPDEDERSQIEAYGYLFQIEKVANKIIEKVRAQRLPDEGSKSSAQE